MRVPREATYKRLEDAKADIRIASLVAEMVEDRLEVLDEGVDHGENEEAWMRHFLTEVMKGVGKSKTKG